MQRRAAVIATLDAAPGDDGMRLRALARDADWLHVRAERCGDLDPDWLHGVFAGPLLYSLARRGPGNADPECSEAARHERLHWAARCYDLVELEAPYDLAPDVLQQVPPGRRLIAWRGEAPDAGVLAVRFAQMAEVEARAYKLVCTARAPADGLVPLRFLASLGRDDTVAYAEGAPGFWSRLIAPHLGSPMIFARLADGSAAPTEVPSAAQLVRDYGLPRLERPRELFGIVGSPVLQSPSPRLHNAGYRDIGRAALYLPFHADSFDSFWDGVVRDPLFETLDIRFGGFTIVSPHKESASEGIPGGSEIVRRSASCNMVHRADGAWRADSTDPEGVLDSLRAAGLRVRGKRAAVVGCGGAGRPIAVALAEAGAEVTLVNRGLERGRRAASLLGMPFVSLDRFSGGEVSIVVHATPLGRLDDDPLPFDPEGLPRDAVLVDLVYAREPTPLVSRARARGCRVFDGHDVLLVQARRQFERMTGSQLALALARAQVRPPGDEPLHAERAAPTARRPPPAGAPPGAGQQAGD